MSLLLYGRVVTFGYVQADDTDLIQRNQPFLTDLSNLPRTFTRSYFAVAGAPDPKAYYRPLVVMSLMLDAMMAGDSPAQYHATNIALHVVAVLLLFWLLVALGAHRMVAWAATLLFAVHPVNVQAVAWLVGRNDPLMSIFGLISMLGLVAYVREPKLPALIAHLTGFALALFTKETGLLLLVVFGLYVWRLTGPVAWSWSWYGSWPGSWFWSWFRSWFRRHWVVPTTYAAVTAVWYVLRARVLAGGDQLDLGPGDYLTVAVAKAPELLLYAGKALLPFRPNTMPGVDAPGVLLGVLATGVLGWALARHVERKTALFASAWFVAFLVPVLFVVGLPAYEHRMYFPMVGLLVGLSQIPALSRSAVALRRTLIATGAMAAVFFVVAFQHTSVFENPYTYWGNGTRGTPHAPIAHINVGRLYETDGNIDLAQRHYSEALALDPTTPNANNNMGVMMTRRDDLERARQYFEAELTMYPSNLDALLNLGLYYKVTNQLDRAVALWERAIVVEPNFVPAYGELAAAADARGESDRAQAYRQRVAGLGGP